MCSGNTLWHYHKSQILGEYYLIKSDQLIKDVMSLWKIFLRFRILSIVNDLIFHPKTNNIEQKRFFSIRHQRASGI